MQLSRTHAAGISHGQFAVRLKRYLLRLRGRHLSNEPPRNQVETQLVGAYERVSANSLYSRRAVSRVVSDVWAVAMPRVNLEQH